MGLDRSHYKPSALNVMVTRKGCTNPSSDAPGVQAPDRRKCRRRRLDRGGKVTALIGFDAQTGEYGDAVKKGIIGPAKVVRVADYSPKLIPPPHLPRGPVQGSFWRLSRVGARLRHAPV